MSVLLIRFDAPMQSWGINEKIKDHYTDSIPSKSAVIGMIAAAEGRSRDQDISDLSKLRFGVRIDKEGNLLPDFQISVIGGNYDKNTPVAKSRVKTSTRYYLQDAIFTCGLEGDIEILNKIKYALLHPAFSLYCGRRGCPITAEFLDDGIVPGRLEDALKKDGKHRAVLDTDKKITKENVKIKNDIPLTFNPNARKYALRKVLETTL